MFDGNIPNNIDECKERVYDELEKNYGKKTDKAVVDKVVNIFFETEGHFSKDTFYEILQNNGVILDKNIVEIILQQLVRFGFAQGSNFEGERARMYEHFHPKRHHDHFICLKCKKVIEFNNGELEELQERIITKAGWKPLYHKLEVYGICDKCSYIKQVSFPVTFAKEGDTVVFDTIKSECKERKQLVELGLVEGTDIYVVKNSGMMGPLILEIKGSRIAIGRGKAQKILVREK